MGLFLCQHWIGQKHVATVAKIRAMFAPLFELTVLYSIFACNVDIV
jgi:hypothetical protein